MFITRIAYNLFSWHVPPSSCFHGVFLFSSRVSLLGFLSLYRAYPFQAGLVMVFSAPNLVFVVCVTFGQMEKLDWTLDWTGFFRGVIFFEGGGGIIFSTL